MRIKGCSKPMCSLCVNFEIKDGCDFCNLKQCETDKKDSCNDFGYDIFKYQGTQNADLTKFSKEDFEI